MNLTKLTRLRKEIENDYKPLLPLADQVKKRMDEGMNDRDAWNIVPGEKQRQFTDAEGNNYQRKIEMLAELFSTRGTVVYPAMGKDYVFKKLGSKLIGIDPLYKDMAQKEKSELAKQGIELIGQDAVEVPDKVKKGYDVLVLKGFRYWVLGKFSGFETIHIRPAFHALKEYTQNLRPGGYVVDCDGFDKELKGLGIVESEIPAPYRKVIETSVPPVSFGAGGQSIPTSNFKIYKKPMVRIVG